MSEKERERVLARIRVEITLHAQSLNVRQTLQQGVRDGCNPLCNGCRSSGWQNLKRYWSRGPRSRSLLGGASRRWVASPSRREAAEDVGQPELLAGQLFSALFHLALFLLCTVRT